MDSISDRCDTDSSDVFLRPDEISELQEDGRFDPILPGYDYEWAEQVKACPVCVIEHSEELHDAVLGVRAWLREKVASSLIPVQIGQKRTRAKEEIEAEKVW